MHQRGEDCTQERIAIPFPFPAPAPSAGALRAPPESDSPVVADSSESDIGAVNVAPPDHVDALPRAQFTIGAQRGRVPVSNDIAVSNASMIGKFVAVFNDAWDDAHPDSDFYLLELSELTETKYKGRLYGNFWSNKPLSTAHFLSGPLHPGWGTNSMHVWNKKGTRRCKEPYMYEGERSEILCYDIDYRKTNNRIWEGDHSRILDAIDSSKKAMAEGVAGENVDIARDDDSDDESMELD